MQHEKKSMNREILRLALPAIFSNITVPLLGLSDTFISGHLGSELYIAAIALGTVMVNSLYWLFGFLRAGTTGLTAEAYGRDQREMMRYIFTASFLLAALLGIALIALSWPLGRLMLLIMRPEVEAGHLAGQYFFISIYSAPALLCTMVVTGWLIGNQNTLYPMVIALSVNVINILFSFTFVFGLEMGFIGVAIGTLVANWIGLGISLILARRLARRSGSAGMLWCAPRGLMSKMDMRRFFNVNSDLMLRSACIMAVTFAMTSFGSRMGNMTLAVNAIIMQMFLFFSYFSDGFAYAAEAMCGRYAGACDRQKLRRSISSLSVWCGAIAVIFTIVYWAFPAEIAGFLADERGVASGVGALRGVVALVPILSVAAFLFDGVYIGLTATRKMLLSTLLSMGCFFIVAMSPMFLPEDFFGSDGANIALWGGFLLFLTLRGVLLGWMLPGTLRNSFGGGRVEVLT